MNNNNNTEYLRIRTSKKVEEFISSMEYGTRHKIIEINFSERYGKQKIQAFVSPSNLQKSFKDLQKKIKQSIPEITAEDLIIIDGTLLDNVHIFEHEPGNEEEDPGDETTAQRPAITFEEWQQTLQEKYEILRETTFKNFSDVWQAIEFTLSVKNVLHIKGNTLPFAGVILGRPSSSKTLALEMLRKVPMTFYTDSFTAKSFVSHNSAVSEDQLKKIDMLPRIKNKLFLTPELAPIFSAKDEDLLNVLGIVTRILDGHGYESDSGVYGHRGYNEDIMFTWVGAAVDIPRKVYKHLSTLGPKLYFIRMVTKKMTEEEHLYDLKFGNFIESKEEVKKAIIDYLKWFDNCPIGEVEFNLMKIKCEPVNDDDYSLRVIIKLGELLSHLRTVAPTWETKGTQGSEYAFTPPTIEAPKRAITNLTNLARGHALSHGRLSITTDDLSIIIRTVLSTAPVERVMIFDLLLKNNGKLTTTEIEESLDVSGPTALRTMTELKALSLVDMKKENVSVYNSIQFIQLKKDFKWFLSEEFKTLREGFVPEKFEEKECKEKSPPPTLKKYDDGEVFDFEYLRDIAWLEYKQIEANEITYENDYLVVEHKNLREAILRNPAAIRLKLTREAADKSIEKLLNQGMISKLREGWYFRTKKDDSAAIAAA